MRKQEEFCLYKEIWAERPHYSEVSGKYLGKEPMLWMFDHLLEKSKYPHLRLEKDNIILVTFEEHEVKGYGYPHAKHQELINKAKQQFL